MLVDIRQILDFDLCIITETPGEPSDEFEYDDISIEVDQGAGTPGALVRAAVEESAAESGDPEAPVSLMALALVKKRSHLQRSKR